MSNRNRARIKKHRLAEQRRLERKKLLSKLKKEIETLENEIKFSKLANRKIKMIRNLKISARALQLVAPYVVTAGVIAGGFAVFGEIPFYCGEEWKTYSDTRSEIDSLGNIKREKKYGSFEDRTNELFYYTKWEKDEDGLYYRTVQEYRVNGKTYDDIIGLFDEEDLKLEDVLGKPKSTVIESKNNITEEEINEDASLKAIVYNKDKSDYIVKKESVGTNVLLSILYVIASMAASLVVYKVRDDVSSFDFGSCVDDIKIDHPFVDVNELAKKLEIKKDNYDRLTR